MLLAMKGCITSSDDTIFVQNPVGIDTPCNEKLYVIYFIVQNLSCGDRYNTLLHLDLTAIYHKIRWSELVIKLCTTQPFET